MFLTIIFSFIVAFITGCNEKEPEKEIDTIKPTVVINNPTTAKAGDEILIDYIASDNITTPENLVIKVTVVKDNQIINVSDNKFIAEAGKYVIKITVTDEAFNQASQVIEINVEEEKKEDEEPTPVGDTTKPILIANVPSQVYAGQEATINYNVSDNETAKENIKIDITVTKDEQEIEVIDNKFIVELGTYDVLIKATDEAGNSTLVIKNLVGIEDLEAPSLVVEQLNNISVGDEVDLVYEAVDNASKPEKLKYEMVLERGSVSRAVDSTFKIIEEGNYSLTMTVTDENGNSATEQISFDVVKTREARTFSTEVVSPTNENTIDQFIDADPNNLIRQGQDYIMKSKGYNISFAYTDNGYYTNYVDASSNNIMFTSPEPIIVYFKESKQYSALYDEIEITRYGIKATGKVQSINGSILEVNDYYYYPDNDSVENAINVQREIIVLTGMEADKGYESIFAILTVDNNPDNIDWFIPNNVFGKFDYSYQKYRIYRETVTGLPIIIFRDSTTGYSMSLARYKPVIDYSTNSYACVGAFYGENSVNSNASSIEINYPTRDTARKYYDILTQPKLVYDLTIMATATDTFDEAYVDLYNNQFMLEDVRIVDNDIVEVYNVINEDFKTLYTIKNNKGLTSYGIPCLVAIENGKVHGCSYQAGFTGQQLACGYNMMVYGALNDDEVSIQNGINIINFWVNDIHMVSEAGVPWTWFEGYYMEWQGYPAFLRMVVDAMEAIFDAYRFAEAHQIENEGWIEAVIQVADWLVRAQNSDGSWYRCYNYEGTIYTGTEEDITYDPGNVAKPSSKNNTPMAVRYLGKVYEYTKDSKYLDSIKKAGEFIYKELYPQNVYIGGTCDNPDCIDKEAGVFAMYAYDTLYTLTREERWLKCLEQATTFTMSTVITVSFKINPLSSNLKAALPLKYGYSDGLSYITCNGTAVDNYAAYIYYQLFRLYVHTGKNVYYKMSEFIQQNTKSTMDWDGAFNYPYKSLVSEASTVYGFTFSAANDIYGNVGIWLPWQSIANGEPIAKMYDTFGVCDVKELKDMPIQELREILYEYGVGGNQHRVF